MVFCEKCGSEIKENSKFCEKCGNKVHKIDDASKIEKRIEHMQGEKKKKTKKPLIFGIIALVVTLVLVVFFGIDGIMGEDGRTPDKRFPIVSDVMISSETFDFKIDRAWATETIICPKEEREYFDSKYLNPIDENTIFFIVEYTFTNKSEQPIAEYPTVQLIDSSGVVYAKNSDVAMYVKTGGTSPDYGVYDEGVWSSQPINPEMSLRGQCTFLIAKSRLDSNGYIMCSRPKISANSAVEMLTGFNFGIAEEAIISLNGIKKEALNVSSPETENYDMNIMEETFSNALVETTESLSESYDYTGSVKADSYYEEEATVGMVQEEEFVLSNSNTDSLDFVELGMLSREEIRIAKNEIYARHGRRFKDVVLQEYFDSKSWYNGYIAPDDFDENVLSQLEKDNIKILQEREAELNMSTN